MMDYTQGKGDYKNWIVSEVEFTPETSGKCESIMYLGNGYMGLRSATEEPYLKETRNLFVSGTFNKADVHEVTELPNLADVTRLDIRVDGERFSLEFGETDAYVRQLNLKTAELTRKFNWTSPKGKEIRFCFKRFVSLDNLHLIGMKMEVESITDPVEITIDSGINAQQSNSGAQHLFEGNRRIYDRRFVELIQTTNESNLDIVIHTGHKVTVNGKQSNKEPVMDMARRNVWLKYNETIQPGEKLGVEKLTTVYTSRDKEFDTADYKLNDLRTHSLNDLQVSLGEGYNALFYKHQNAWWNKVWKVYSFEVDSDRAFDQLAFRFALYHLTVMTPAHDARMGIGAKALSGEGYKGHSFWDTEIFILPFFIYANPDVAKSLLTYRFNGLAGARRKAYENGYEGAMYPWEAAWPTDGEVTPLLGDVDIVTGEQTRIWPGLIEQHITSDIAFAVYQYFQVSGDLTFMENMGYEMVFDTAIFWASRLEWDGEAHAYHINNVIGPDEYKEHVSNNAYTNYMAYFNLKLASRYYEKLQHEDPKLLGVLDEKLNLEKAYSSWCSKADHLYLPLPQKSDAVIPQDDTYLTLKEIDLRKYKNQDQVRGLYKDYNPEQINKIQVTKQADTVILLYLLDQTFLKEDLQFTEHVKRANFNFYEPRTLHDSSLSLSTHTIMANDLGKTDLAYSLFKEASVIDLGPNMHSSDEGVHAASIGGIMSAVMFGFAGIRLHEGKLSVNPRLPKKWHQLAFTIQWKGQPIMFSISKTTLSVKVMEGGSVTFDVFERAFECRDYINIAIG